MCDQTCAWLADIQLAAGERPRVIATLDTPLGNSSTDSNFELMRQHDMI
jgi:hypothetical protein